MYKQAELLDALDELNNARHTIQNCEKMAAIYTLLDHLYPVNGYSGDFEKVDADTIQVYGNSEFLKSVNGKPAQAVWLLLDELADALSVLNPKLYNNFIDKLNEI